MIKKRYEHTYIYFEASHGDSMLYYLLRKITRKKQTLANFWRDLCGMTVNYV